MGRIDPRWLRAARLAGATLVPSLLILVIALGLYVYRVVVQEKKSLQLRLPAATMPEEEAMIGAPTSTV